jgi:hypothetical protein
MFYNAFYYYYCRMLSDKEKQLLKEILILLSEEDLQLLAETVTDNMIVPLTTEGKCLKIYLSRSPCIL